jgi:hypothetical protein
MSHTIRPFPCLVIFMDFGPAIGLLIPLSPGLPVLFIQVLEFGTHRESPLDLRAWYTARFKQANVKPKQTKPMPITAVAAQTEQGTVSLALYCLLLPLLSCAGLLLLVQQLDLEEGSGRSSASSSCG